MKNDRGKPVAVAQREDMADNSQWSPHSCRAVTLAAIDEIACANKGVSPAYSYFGSIPSTGRPAK